MEYYEHSRGEDKSDKGLSIGDYKSAFLVDLVTSFLLKKTEKNFEKTWFHGIYRDNGFVVFEGNISFTNIQGWLSKL